MRNLLLAAALGFSLPLTAMAQMATSGPNANLNASGGSAPKLSGQDETFITLAATSGLSEVQEGQLAQQKGNSAVQAVGNRMVTDHTKINSQLASVASGQGFTPPTSLTPHQQAQYSQLQGLSGQAFDSAYLTDQKAAHLKAIKVFRTEYSQGTNPQLKMLANQTLPILRMHLKMIENAMGSTQQASAQ